MRDVVRSVTCAIAVLALSGLAASAEPRIIETENADYTGFDHTTLQDTTLEACHSACLADDRCKAFTFNTSANWCFLKSDFSALTFAEGAVAGRVVDAIDLTPGLQDQRLAMLEFVPDAYLDEARSLVVSLPARFDAAGAGYESLREEAAQAYRNADYSGAAIFAGRALSVADDDSGLWLDFAAASVARTPQNWSDRRAAYADGTAAAINAYVRADEPIKEASALALMGDGFRLREVWKPAYRAYRASLAIRENNSVRRAYEDVIAEHGFRVASHEVDADVANPRICVTFSDDLPVNRPELADFVTVEPSAGLAIERETRQICIDGVAHGTRYAVRLRNGLPAADGEVLERPVSLDIFVRDRAPWVGFAGNAYVLPAGDDATIPLASVNADVAEAVVYRIGERGLAGALRDNQFLRALAPYAAQTIAREQGEKVWEGEVLIDSELNQTVTTAIPIGEAVETMRPGVYAITARAELDPNEWGTFATQWFIVSDLGLTTLTGSDGVHVFVRSLSTAEPVTDATLRLVATNNDILGEAVTNDTGYAVFAPGLARGTGGATPQMVDVSTAAGDYAFLDLARAAFDLSDRGVEGRPAPGPLDVFITTERGIYRPGETVHLTALVRDAQAIAVPGLPITLVIERPDGVEYLNDTLSDAGLGGYSISIPLEDSAMRGSWRAKLYADPEGSPLAEAAILVEDFVPERLAFTLSSDATAFTEDAPVAVDLEARYLYGAPAPGLSVDGDIEVRASGSRDGFSGYRFGLADDPVRPLRRPIDLVATTDTTGHATLDVGLPDPLPVTTRPLAGKAIVRLTDTNGRAVERTLDLPVTPSAAMIGVKPQFDGDEVDEGSTVGFDVVLVSPDGARLGGETLSWQLDRIETEYQWYRTGGNWNYELITIPRRVASGEVATDAAASVPVSTNVDWGRYRLTVERSGAVPAATSVDFRAGWAIAAAGSETPDVLAVALDKPAYRAGDTAKLRLDPRFAGVALVNVVDDRLISTMAVDVPEEGTTVDLAVTGAWGAGAYVTASLYRPMDVPARRMPARALGLAWAKVAPGDRDLAVSLGVDDEIQPRGPMTIPVTVDNLPAGEPAFVTVAAVDVGILNLTDFQTPAPDDWYFGQRKLGTDIRDLYGLLIDRMQGVPGTIRSGGDGAPTRLAAPPPTEKLVAFYSGIVALDDQGTATISFDLPEFNGSVRVMAMAWSRTGVGHAAKDVLVRDPVVVAASLPRFLRTGDTSRLLIEIDNVAGVGGDYALSVHLDAGVGLSASDRTRTLSLESGGKVRLDLPISGIAVGDHAIDIVLETPDDESFAKTLALGIRPPGEPVTRRNVVELAGGGTLTVDTEPLAEYVPDTATVTVSIGGAGRLDVAGILAALDRYPYGCTEQLTSRALPLVYLDSVAASIGVASDTAVRERVQTAIAGVLANQSANGSFGLWGPYGGGNLWLDAYVTDFLTRADEKGYDVPALPLRLALDNLANRIAYADDFQNGGEDVAYTLYVLARNGKASLGDLRYYAEAKIDNFGTALAKAQVGAALALYGEQRRAADAFRAAISDLDGRRSAAWRGDYGSPLRDTAAVLTLAAETNVGVGDLQALASDVAEADARRRYTSTQENAWMLLAAAALIDDAQRSSFEIDGASVAGPLFREYGQSRIEASPVRITNLDDDNLEAMVATTGVTRTPEPAGGEGFAIERAFFTPDGEPMDIGTVGQNQRVVVVVTVTGDRDREGQVMVVDPVPAGYEIENPNISASGDVRSFPWLDVSRNASHTEARTDRFVAALDRRDGDALAFKVAYAMRAVSPGVFVHPGATVEDMYRPYLRARTTAGSVEVVGPTR
ncbi:alpha-2-macroglobulin family protein [Bauldia sp.]|uniref:alpha-2-macroglobulin family protein n=1 Tax=Bauldia sp. TaxID=2575872 RepID=UPI003BACB3AE